MHSQPFCCAMLILLFHQVTLLKFGVNSIILWKLRYYSINVNLSINLKKYLPVHSSHKQELRHPKDWDPSQLALRHLLKMFAKWLFDFAIWLYINLSEKSDQGWPNHCPGIKQGPPRHFCPSIKQCPPRHFQVPFDFFWKLNLLSTIDNSATLDRKVQNYRSWNYT